MQSSLRGVFLKITASYVNCDRNLGTTLYRDTTQIWMLTIYPKNVTENIPGHVLKKIKEEIDG